MHTNLCETKRPGRLSLGLAMAAMVLLLNACSSHRPEVAMSGGERPVMLRHGADLETRDRFWAGVKPVSTLAQAHYKLGRYYQKRGKHQEAIDEFAKALELDQGFVLAYNGMGVSYDALGECEAAKKAYAEALRLGPSLAYVHNNLGCSRLLCNDPEQAMVHLSKAAELDTTIPRIQNNLLLAELRFQQRFPEKQAVAGLTSPVQPPERLGTTDRQQAQPEATAAAPPAPSLAAAADVPPAAASAVGPAPQQSAGAVPPAPAAPAAIAQAVAASAEPAAAAQPVTEAITIHPVVPVEREKAQDKAAAPTHPNVPLGPIEIANGNGVTGLASRSAQYLRSQGFTIGRIINAPHYNHGISTIYYQEGYHELAKALAAKVPGPQVIERQKTPRQAGNGVRLLLGKDMADIRFSTHLAQKNNGGTQPANPKALLAGLK